VLRVHLTAEDLRRIRIRATNSQAAETLHGLDGLRRGTDPRLVDQWKQRFGTDRLPGDDLRHTTKLLADLWAGSFNVDLVTVLGSGSPRHAGLDAFRQSPTVIINAPAQTGLDTLASLYGTKAVYRPEQGTRDRAQRADQARQVVPAALEEFRRSTLAPAWEQTHTQLDAEHIRLAKAMTESGIDAMLDSLDRSVRWRPPVLEVDAAGLPDLDVRPEGRGLTIVPSLFSPLGHVATADLRDPAGTFGLFYPAIRPGAHQRAGSGQSVPPSHKVLAALLGSTRASVLQAIAEGPCTTSELAARVGTSLASASQHATVLRNAGLIATERYGSAVLHQLTARGYYFLA
jgi:DNA-binding transcriptional ArsR family regulator